MKHRLKIVPFGGFPPRKNITWRCDNAGCPNVLVMPVEDVHLWLEGIDVVNMFLTRYPKRLHKWLECRGLPIDVESFDDSMRVSPRS